MTYRPAFVPGQIPDANNTAVLASGDTSPGSPWVGDWTRTRSAGVIRVLSVVQATDVTEGGLGGAFTFEFSEDGATPTISESLPIGDFRTARAFDLLNAGEWYRTSFEPDRPLASDTVEVVTTLRRQYDGQFARLADQPVERQNVAIPNTFAFIRGWDTNGIARDIPLGSNGGLIQSDSIDDIALGLVPGVTPLLKFGRNPDVDSNTTPEDVWQGGGVYTGQDLSIVLGLAQIVSTDTDDDGSLSNPGAHTVRVWGLSSGDYITEDVEVTGTTPASTVNQYERIFRARVITGGSAGWNVGTITVSDVGTGLAYAVIPPQLNQSQVGAFTVPTTIGGVPVTGALIRTARITMARTTGNPGSANVTLRIRPPGGVFAAIRSFEVTNSLSGETLGPLEITPGSDIKFRVEDVSDMNTIVFGEMDAVFFHPE